MFSRGTCTTNTLFYLGKCFRDKPRPNLCSLLWDSLEAFLAKLFILVCLPIHFYDDIPCIRDSTCLPTKTLDVFLFVNYALFDDNNLQVPRVLEANHEV